MTGVTEEDEGSEGSEGSESNPSLPPSLITGKAGRACHINSLSPGGEGWGEGD